MTFHRTRYSPQAAHKWITTAGFRPVVPKDAPRMPAMPTQPTTIRHEGDLMRALEGLEDRFAGGL